MQIQTKLTAHVVSFTRTKDAEWEVGIRVRNYTIDSDVIIDAYSKAVVEVWDLMDCESSGCFLIETTLEVQINGDLVVGETNHE